MIKLNKPPLASFTILCLLFISLITECRISVKAELTTLYVDDDNITGPWDGTKEHPYQNITNALEHSIDGDTIFVRAGTYYENVMINKSISLLGEDRYSTIVDSNKIGNVIYIATNNVSVENFTIKESGLQLYDSGIFVGSSSGNNISNNIITNNVITSNYEGISLYFSSNNVVYGNEITSNYEGISLYFSSNNVVYGNEITSNDQGISLYYFSSHNVVYGNEITSNDQGISLYFSSHNVVYGNEITSNYEGIHLAFHNSNNTVYCNNFNNIYQAWSDSKSIWDYRGEGNYWSNYTGQDLNGDGIGDNPHVIDVNNQDNYPLMGIFSDFNISFERETYHVTTICNSTISDFNFKIGTETGNKIISFNAISDDNSVGFCRITIPTELLMYPYIVLINSNWVTPTLLEISNTTVRLYFTYLNNSTITIISPEAYNELMDRYLKLQIDLLNLSSTYYALLNNYSIVLGNYSQLQESYNELNSSLQEHLLDYSEQIQNIRSLMYITAAITAIFIITAIYLSKRTHANVRPKTTLSEGKEQTSPSY